MTPWPWMRVLVVEDEIGMADALRRGLEAEGFAVDWTGDGVDAVWRATENSYDAIVLDIMLPGLNGYRVCAELRARSIWTPVLMLTAKDGDLDEAEALDTGADDYLAKPFSWVVLVARLRALLRRGAPARPVDLTVDDLVLDRVRHRCWRGDVQIALTPRELALLEHLMREPGRIVTKGELLLHVWNLEQGEGDANVVEVYIGYLRRKIDQPFGRSSIETVRGAGYRLVPSG